MSTTALLLLTSGAALIVLGRPRRRVSVQELLGEGPFDPSEHVVMTDDGPTGTPASEAERRRLSARVVLHHLADPFRSLARKVENTAIERDLVLAGLATTIGVAEVYAAQGIGLLLGVGAAALLAASGLLGGASQIVACGCLVFAGAMFPRASLQRRAATRQRALNSAVSDALDLLTLCVEAGLAFDAALSTVSDSAPGPLGEELRRTVAEMRLGLSRSEALENLRTRNDSPSLNSFVVALLQADQLGTPVGRILAGQAAEARLRRRQEVREQAGKLPVRILIPTVLLIFPPTFVVLLGPAMSSIRSAF